LARHDAWTRIPPLTLAAALAIGLATSPAAAQGLDAPEAIDSIVQSDVHEEEAEASADTGKVIAAIEKAGQASSDVRKVTTLDRLDIVFLSDAVAVEGGPPPEIAEKLAEYGEEVEALRRELTGNAMLFHAIDSRNILPQDVLGIEFDDARGAIIYAAARPAN
jgi:hypothetical protein